MDLHLYNSVKNGLVDLLGARSYFGSKVLTPYCYTLGNTTAVYLLNVSCSPLNKGLTSTTFVLLDVEIKLDEEGYVLPASHIDEVYKR